MIDPISEAPHPAARTDLLRVTRFIEERFAERITLGDLAAVAGLSVSRLVKVFGREIGTSPHRYLCAVRVSAAQRLMRAGVPPAVAATEVGFFDQSHLCRHFRAVCGMTPRRFLAHTEYGEPRA